ncbi:unnamed protein product [Protopolystoma xenopodis]|uniref:Uncharacterized protein n=1 Tax=Protopolystoma xenopodis TaxID=117903 RepID=A0A3S5APU6_9PLAT|nr:unnamed protein product [Protopolystoma xenopodis]
MVHALSVGKILAAETPLAYSPIASRQISPDLSLTLRLWERTSSAELRLLPHQLLPLPLRQSLLEVDWLVHVTCSQAPRLDIETPGVIMGTVVAAVELVDQEAPVDPAHPLHMDGQGLAESFKDFLSFLSPLYASVSLIHIFSSKSVSWISALLDLT